MIHLLIPLHFLLFNETVEKNKIQVNLVTFPMGLTDGLVPAVICRAAIAREEFAAPHPGRVVDRGSSSGGQQRACRTAVTGNI